MLPASSHLRGAPLPEEAGRLLTWSPVQPPGAWLQVSRPRILLGGGQERGWPSQAAGVPGDARLPGGVCRHIQLVVFVEHPAAETAASDWALGLAEPLGGFADRGPWTRAVCCWRPHPWHCCDLGGRSPRRPHGSREPALGVRVQQLHSFELKIEEELEIQPISQPHPANRGTGFREGRLAHGQHISAPSSGLCLDPSGHFSLGT